MKPSEISVPRALVRDIADQLEVLADRREIFFIKGYRPVREVVRELRLIEARPTPQRPMPPSMPKPPPLVCRRCKQIEPHDCPVERREVRIWMAILFVLALACVIGVVLGR